jgi:hypothetical protein
MSSLWDWGNLKIGFYHYHLTGFYVDGEFPDLRLHQSRRDDISVENISQELPSAVGTA